MSEQFTIELPQQFTIATAMLVSEKMFESLKSGAKEVKIDGSKVERADASAVQLLCSYAKTASKEHMKFSFKDPSESLKSSFSILGLINCLNQE